MTFRLRFSRRFAAWLPHCVMATYLGALFSLRFDGCSPLACPAVSCLCGLDHSPDRLNHPLELRLLNL